MGTVINTVLSSFTFMIFILSPAIRQNNKNNEHTTKSSDHGQTAAIAEVAMAKQVATGMAKLIIISVEHLFTLREVCYDRSFRAERSARERPSPTEGVVRVIAGELRQDKNNSPIGSSLYSGIMPGHILCVTFTDKAAGEMSENTPYWR